MHLHTEISVCMNLSVCSLARTLSLSSSRSLALSFAHPLACSLTLGATGVLGKSRARRTYTLGCSEEGGCVFLRGVSHVRARERDRGERLLLADAFFSSFSSFGFYTRELASRRLLLLLLVWLVPRLVPAQRNDASPQPRFPPRRA